MVFLYYGNALVVKARERVSQFVGKDTAFPAFYVLNETGSLRVHQPRDMRSLTFHHHEYISGDGIPDRL